MSESQETTAMPSSVDAVSVKMQEGLQEIAVRATVGLVVGGMAGVVLSRGGGSSMRKVLAGFGAGVGGGSAWTKCSISIDEMVSSATK
mmetsp:Transcript_34303/g.83244  ORF Transcript_34303/g.83244 Transcript_34303/m.83244 type:complete len:88 (+) Transcript_34303:1986-2249(+)